jgi:hypothetical protein
MERAEKFKIEFYLSCLVPNLQTVTGDLPTLDETLAAYAQNASLREKIAELAASDGVNRFYAAILLWPVEKAKADQIFAGLAGDETLLTVPKSLGHGAVEIPIYLLARDFTNEKAFPGESLSRIETLANWKTAVATEKRRAGKAFDENSLPRYEEVRASRTDAERLKELRVRIEELKTGSAAEKFYAAALVEPLDADETRRILEGLLSEPAEVGVLSGDIMLNFPASQIAARLLGQTVPEEEPPDQPNPVARFLKWLGG